MVDLILGPVAITWPNAMMGEVTPRMAEAITTCRAPKALISLHQENIFLVGASREPLPHLVETLLDQYAKEILKDV
jgi:predicted aconitase with swiveling domain